MITISDDVFLTVVDDTIEVHGARVTREQNALAKLVTARRLVRLAGNHWQGEYTTREEAIENLRVALADYYRERKDT